MNYLTNYYKNLSEQLQEQVNILSQKVRLLIESDTYAGDAQETPGEAPGANPWIEPDWHPPELNPNQSPVRPLDQRQWERDNPKPQPYNYPGGYNDPDYQRDLQRWKDAREQANANYMRWYRYMRGLNRITGQGKDKEWELPNFGDPENVNTGYET